VIKFKRLIDNNGITEDIIPEIIAASKLDHTRMLKLYERYKAAEEDGPEIFNRSALKYDSFGVSDKIQRLDDKVNNQLNNAFDADIVDTKIGYMFGHPISYEVDEESKEKKSSTKDEQKNEPKEKTKHQLILEEFLLRNNVEDNDPEYGKLAAICGKGARLVYIDRDGYERIKNIDPWEVSFIGDNIHEPDYSLRHYKYDNVIYAEFYDDTNIYYFVQDKNGKFELEDIQPHMFEYNPLFGLANNREMQADAEKVMRLIDAYDRTLSDASNEIEQYRLAYLVLKGLGADEETMEKIRKQGWFELYEETDDVKYLTKDINDSLIEHHLDRLEKNILRFAKSVNFTDEAFGGTITGVAMRFKLLALENKCITMERKFVSSLRYQFKVIFSAWYKRHAFAKEDYLKVWFGFKRNLPANILDEAQTTAQLKGNVSERTRLSLLSFVDDVDYELEEMQKEQDEYSRVLGDVDDDIDLNNDLDNSSSKKSKGDKEEPCPECGGSGKTISKITGNTIQCKKCGGDGVVG
jgi:SPP1 family phage portal protein